MGSTRFAAFLVVALVSSAAAQDLPEPKAATELDQVLRAWENATSTVHRVACGFRRFKYDDKFAIEKRARGSLLAERPPRILYKKPYVARLWEAYYRYPTYHLRYRLHADGTRSGLDTIEQPFRADLGKYTDERAVVSLNDPRPVSVDAADIRDFRLIRPFLLTISAAGLKREFTITLVSNTADEVRLKLVRNPSEPHRVPYYADRFDHVEVILDRGTWLPKAFKIRELGGAETVHVFHDMTLDASAKPKKRIIN